MDVEAHAGDRLCKKEQEYMKVFNWAPSLLR